MPATKYIRPMSFGETISTLFRLYRKIVFPILALNIVVFTITLGVGVLSGAFVGPVLLLTSNVILERPVNVWQSVKRGLAPGLLLKTAVISFVYIVLISLMPMIWESSGYQNQLGEGILFLLTYLLLLPVWVFVPMIMILEKKGLRSSIRRSFELLRMNFSRILRMDISITLPFTILAFLPLLGFDLENILYGDLVWEGIYFALSIAAVTGINSLPYVFVYYEYRARHENYTEELLAQELGYQPIEEMMTV